MLEASLAEKVFVMTGYPEYTYVEREEIDITMQTALRDKGTHIYLIGESKSGKSSLWAKYLSLEERLEPIIITRQTTIENLYNDIFKRLRSFMRFNAIQL
ncbi:MAG: hypothetical protein VR69_13055 [Peptococcaceae bacterium BRH_c4b]|nr:MAG: hypothetical protein VR69_13055 [Peptococcaceae bacterium BRH_c4b]